MSVVRWSSFAVAVGACVVAMAGAAGAALARNYAGSLYLQPRDRTTLHLGVQLRKERPYAFTKMRSGPIPLQCDQGQDSVRLAVNFPRHVSLPLIAHNGRFRTKINDFDDGSTFFLWGVIHRRHAHGGLRYRRDDETHGHCSTDGRLVWLLRHR